MQGYAINCHILIFINPYSFGLSESPVFYWLLLHFIYFGLVYFIGLLLVLLPFIMPIYGGV
jgi:hypothetical protein